MNRVILIIVLLIFSIKATGCVPDKSGTALSKMNKGCYVEIDALLEMNESNCTSENDRIDDTQVKERHIYNENNPDKNLFLQFLHDEIPITHYPYEWIEGTTIYKTLYFSEIIDEFGFYPELYMVDMDGDGIQEYCFRIVALLNTIKYNEELGCFEIWLQEREQQKPIGNGQMYSKDFHTDTRYGYYLYDKNANLIEYKLYTVTPMSDGNGGECVKYSIWDEEKGVFDVVTEEVWNKETKFLFELIDHASKPMSYEELLGD
ncbi:hypothetical protein [Candidatus Merdisoma sp. JLR.KK006]|uniref:hypothetical protein n=1 Tax=Candidatus Merdisoma sp. JLR.KK006 TaxID=3112626 RepID=UPI002FF25CFF